MGKIVEVTSQADLDKVVAGNKNVLVDFWAPWCGPCRMIAPVLDEIAADENGVTVAKINTDENGELCKTLGIRSIPTLFKYVDGKHTDTQVGAGSKEMLLAGLVVKKEKGKK